MNCCVIGCERQARYNYKLREVKFVYCKRHKIIPDILIGKIKLFVLRGIE